MKATPRISRRTVIQSALAGASTLAFPAIGQGPTKVTFTTSWTPEGPNLFAYVARDRGFWKKYGLDVSVARGSGSGAAAQAVGTLVEYYVEATDAAAQTRTWPAPSDDLGNHDANALYQVDNAIRAVVHVHSAGLWEANLNRLPTTKPEVAYGTPEMASARRRD